MRNQRPHSRYLLYATLILLGAAFLRLADLDRYPPGLHYDEAADMLLSRDVALFGYRPFPVVEAYSGREALFYYLAAPMIHLVGADVLATRLTSALLGILTVAATIALGTHLWRRREIALLAGAWLAVNGAQVWLTRQGFRTSPQPALEALALWLLWLALRRNHRWLLPALLAGVCAGLTLYVYMAARVFPVWLILPLGLLIVLDGAHRVRRLKQVTAFFAALVVTALPIALYYLTHLDVFADRLAQLAPSGNTLSLLESLMVHLRMFFLEGDPLLRYNLTPGRPFFDAISGLLLLLGLGACAWWVRPSPLTPLPRKQGEGNKTPPAPPNAADRVVAGFVLLSPLLIAPSVIAVGGLPPSHMRSVAMVPLIFFAPAVGLWLIGRVVNARLPRVGRWRAMAAITLMVALGVWTWRDYQAWASRPDLFYDSDGDLDLAAAWFTANAAPDTLVYIGSVYYQHPTVLARPIDPARLRWMMNEHIFLPPPDREGLLIFPRSVDVRQWTDWLPSAWHVNGLPHGPDGQPAFTAFRIPVGDRRIAWTPPDQVLANVGGVFELAAASLPSARSGDHADVSLIWRVLATPGRDDLTPVVILTDAWEEEIARVHPYVEYSGGWQPGETFIQRLGLPIPPGNPPGTYRVKVAWVGKARPNDYLSLLDAEGRFAGLWAEAGTLTVSAGQPTPLPDGTVREVAPGLYILGTPAAPPTVDQGATVRFTVNWYAEQAQPRAGAITLIARREDGEAFTLWTGHPVRDTYPLSRWTAGESVIDRYAVPIPPTFPAGRYMLRLLVGDAPAFESPLEVLPVERTFDIPVLATPVDLTFGDAIRLRGYEVKRTGEGEIMVTLAWQAIRPSAQDYTVFVHVVGADGINFSQRDEQPTRPTTQWSADEVIVTTYTLPTPPGAFTVRAGLYLQANGQRLPIRDAAGQPLGDVMDVSLPR